MNSEEEISKIFKINDISSFTSFVNANVHASERIYSDKIPETAPKSLIQALLARQLALGVTNGWTDNSLRAKWQNYWLSCCRSSKCDYLFTLMKEIKYDDKCSQSKIDREEDIVKLCDQNNQNNVLWKYLKMGKKSHLDLYVRFLLRRYAWYKAFKLWCRIKNISLINFILPRLVGALLIGFLPFLEPSIWKVIVNMNRVFYWMISLFFVVFSFIYLLYDCFRVLEGSGRKALVRASCVTIYGLLVGFLFSKLGICLLKDTYAEEFLTQINYERPSLFFSSAALFIGIFIQVLWEEKTIAEPL